MRSLAGLLIVAVCVVLSSPALCAENDKAVARAHYETATRLYDLREYAKALDEYKAAYLAKPDPAFLFNIGQCFRKLNNTASALDFYRQYLKKTPDEDPNRAQAEARIHDIEIGRESDDDPFAKPDENAARLPDPQSVPALPPERPRPPEVVTQPVPNRLPAEGATVSHADTTQPAGVDLAVPSPPKEDHVSRPIYGSWWLWAGVGAVVAAGTVAVIILSKGGSEPNTATTTLGTQAAFP